MGLTSLEDAIKGQLQKHNNTHFTLVDGMSKLMTTNQVTKCQSSDFQVSGVKWNLRITSDAAEGCLYCYLITPDEKSLGSNREVKWKLSLVSLTGVDVICEPLSWPSEASKSVRGRNNVISYTMLKQKYLVKDKAAFGAEILHVSPKPSVTSSIYRTMGTAERIKLTEVPRKNSRFTWKITQFSSFDGEHHSSYEFTVGQRRWKLLMYPKGNKDGKGNSLSLYLTATEYVTNGPKAATLAVFKLRVLDQLKRNHHETRHEILFSNDPDPLKTSRGASKFLSLGELYNASRGLLVNDEIYIGVEFLFVSTTENL